MTIEYIVFTFRVPTLIDVCGLPAMGPEHDVTIRQAIELVEGAGIEIEKTREVGAPKIGRPKGRKNKVPDAMEDGDAAWAVAAAVSGAAG